MQLPIYRAVTRYGGCPFGHFDEGFQKTASNNTKGKREVLTDAHQLPDEPVAHFDSSHQDKHVKDQFAHIVPHNGCRREAGVRQGRWCGGKRREDHTG